MGRVIAQEIRTRAWTAEGEPVEVVAILAMEGAGKPPGSPQDARAAP